MPAIRISTYLITIPLKDQRYVLMHGYSGAMDIVDVEIVSLLSNNQDICYEEYNDQELVEFLLKRGYLTIKSEEEEYNYVFRLAEALHKKDKILYNSFTALVTYSCNFKCSYCFEKGILLENQSSNVMTNEMINNMYQTIEQLCLHNQCKTKELLLYGGEPLLAENLKSVEYIVDQGVKLGYRFMAITNGYDLEVYEHLLSNDKIHDIQITIDGMEEMHNSKRQHRKGVPTFAKIISNIEMALKHGVGVNVRFNTDRTNIGELIQLKNYFDTLNYTKYPNFNIDSAILIDPENLKSSTHFNSKDFFAEHDQLDYGYICHDYNMYSKVMSAIKTRKPLHYSATFCNSQIGSYVFDPFGNIYPCIEVVGNKQHIIGTYLNGILEIHSNELQNWHNANVMQNKNCRKCKYALLCGGGCHAHNIQKHKCIQIDNVIKYAVNKAYSNINT